MPVGQENFTVVGGLAVWRLVVQIDGVRTTTRKTAT
jgi:hypothetical protein